MRHDPVIPGVTDKLEALDRLFKALQGEGITSVDVGYLYIRPGIAQLLRDELPPEVSRPLLRQFRAGPIEEVAASANTQLLSSIAPSCPPALPCVKLRGINLSATRR